MRRFPTLCLALGLVGCTPSGDKANDSSSTATTTTTGSTGTVAQPPIAQDDVATVEEGGATPVSITANDLLTTFPLALDSVAVVSPPQFGSIVVNPSGTVDYTHDGGESASDGFSYTIDDTAGTTSNVATVSIDVSPVNDLPTAADDADSVAQGGVVTLDLLANDFDADDGLDVNALTIVDAPLYANLVDNGDGTVDYEHDGTGVAIDGFTYTIADHSGAVSNVATVDIAVSTTNLPPSAGDDVAVVDEGGLGNVDVLYNDYDADDGLDPSSVVVVTAPSNGVAVVQANGSIDYTHDGSETNNDFFGYRVTDYSGAPTMEAFVQIIVALVNDPPTAVDDVAPVTEGLSTNVTVLSNDTDPDSALDPLSVTLGSTPQYGTAIVTGNGSIDYTHNGTQVAFDSFTYFVADTSGAVSNEATVQMQINLLNDPPTAGDDAGSVSEAGSTVIDLAANDGDSDDGLDLSSIVVYSAPSSGTVLVNGDGTVEYDHDGSETLSDSFAYTIDDNSGFPSNVALVTLTVAPVNDAPVAVNDNFVVAEGGLNNLQNVLSNDSDADDGLSPSTVVVDTQPINGLVAVNLNGTIVYNHDGSNTVADSYTYRVQDNSGVSSNTATVNIVVTGTNDPPQAGNNNGLVNEGGSQNIDVLANDSDSDNGIDPTTTTVVTAPANGSAVAQPGGSITYTHNGGETVSDSFTYIVRDLAGLTSNEATVTMVINPVNDPPTAVNDSAVVAEGGAGAVPVLANDTDPDSAINPATLTVTSPPSHGTAVVGGSSITYTHNGSDTLADSFTYTVADTSGAVSSAATVSITVSPVNDLPVAVNDNGGAVNEGAAKNVAVLANDTDVDDGLNPSSVQVVTAPAHGSTNVLGDGSITYTHNGDEQSTDSFTYTVRDFAGAVSNAATVSFTVNPINDPPVGVNDNFGTSEGGSTNLAVLANDTDADDGINVASVVIVSAPSNGTANAMPNGTVAYTHNGSNTVSDSFTYRMSDNAGAQSAVTTVSLAITPVNDPPVAVNDSATLNEGALAVVNVSANDSDPDDGLDLASITIVTSPTRGSTVVHANGTVNYTHNGSETTSDSFTYTIRDNSGAASAAATVSLTVTPVNDPPIASNDAGTVAEGALLNVNVLANDTDVDNAIAPATATVVTAPSNGSAVVQGNGTINYTHNGGETLSDSFTYRVQDVAGAQSNTATVSLTVTPVNDPPVAVGDSYNVSEGTTTDFAVLANDSDVDDGLNVASVNVQSGPANGTASPLASGAIRYTHNGGITTSDSFTYRVRDNAGANSNTVTVNIAIATVNDPPVAANDSAGVSEGAMVNINVLSNDSDPDDGLDSGSVAIVSGPANGSTAVQGNGTINYTHNGGETVSDSFTYRVRDMGGLLSNTATVTIAVSPVNDPPVASADSFSVSEGALGNLSVLSNDSDPDSALNVGSVQIMASPTNGSALPLPTGVVQYTHNGSETLSDSFTYRVSDTAGANSNTVTVTLTITPVNDPPVASADTAVVNEGAGVSITVLANDTDPDDGLNPGTVVVSPGPTRGTAVVQPGGSILYTHNGGETTSDSFSYTVRDNAGVQSNSAGVSITVNPVNDPPVANPDDYTVDQGGAVILRVLDNDTDVDSALNTGSIFIVSGPSDGVANTGPGGTIVYTHSGGPAGPDSLTYRVSDVDGAVSNTTTVSIDVYSVNVPPTAYDDYEQTLAGGFQSFYVAGNDYDPDDGLDLWSIEITQYPFYGDAYVGGPGEIEYQIFGGYGYFTEEIRYIIYDYSGAASNEATLYIDVFGNYYY